MTGKRKLWITVFVFGAAGLSWFIFLLVRHHLGDVKDAFAKAGWGIGAVVACHLIVLLCNGLAWHFLFPPEKRLPFRTLMFFRWIGESVQNLFPLTAVGGEVIRARLATTRGIPGAMSAAAVITDITLGIFAQIAFTLSGVYLLGQYTGRTNVTTEATFATILGVAAAGGFFLVQRYGLFRVISGLVRKISSNDAMRALAQHGEKLDEEVRGTYARSRGLWASFFWSCMNWSTGVGETWIALLALGTHASFGQAWMVESIQQAVRAAAFLVPGGIGVQEESYLMLGNVIGLPGEISLTLALIRRVRELSFGIPGLIAWQFAEGKHLFGSRKSQPEANEANALQTETSERAS